jgi:hypothetical protein
MFGVRIKRLKFEDSLASLPVHRGSPSWAAPVVGRAGLLCFLFFIKE